MEDQGLPVSRRPADAQLPERQGRIFLYLIALAAKKKFVMMLVIEINNLR